MARNETYTELWYRALEAEVGIGIETDNIKHLRNELYRARELIGDPELDQIIIITPPSGKEVWLCKKQMNRLEK